MTIVAGSIAFVASSFDDANPQIAFVVLRPISSGDVIRFVDGNLDNSDLLVVENSFTWTAGADIAAGTVIELNFNAGVTAGTWTSVTDIRGLGTTGNYSAGFDWQIDTPAGGDSLYAITNTATATNIANPGYVAVIQFAEDQTPAAGFGTGVVVANVNQGAGNDVFYAPTPTGGFATVTDAANYYSTTPTNNFVSGGTPPTGNFTDAGQPLAGLQTITVGAPVVRFNDSLINNTEKAATTLTISGVGTGSTATVTIASSGGAGTKTFTGLTNGSSVAVDLTGLADGTLSISSVSVVGTSTTSFLASSYSSVSSTLDSAAPSASIVSVTDDFSPVTATYNTSVTTAATSNDTTPTLLLSFNGTTTQAGDTIQVLVNGSAVSFRPGTPLASPVTSYALTAGNISGGLTLVVSSGALGSDGLKAITIRAADSAGNTTTSSAFNLTLDTQAPGQPSITAVNDNAGTVQGDLSNGAFTDDTQLRLSGSAEANSTVTIRDGSTTLGSVTADGTGAWTYTTTTLASGAHSFTVVAADAAGNTSNVSGSFGVTVDTTAPNAPVVNYAPTIVNASEASDGESFTVQAENGSFVTVTFTNGLNTVVKTGTVSGPDLTVTLSQSELVNTLGQGTINISATARDAAGNTSSPGTDSFVLDTLAPNAPVITTVNDDQAPTIGNLAGGSTNDARLTFGGTAEAGSTVTLYAVNTGTNAVTTLGTATATGGSWSITPAASQPDGTYTYYATATDAGGNVSVNSTVTASYTIDTVVPGAPNFVHTAANAILNAAEVADGETFSFTADANVTVTASFAGSQTTLSNLATTQGPAGTYSVFLSSAQLAQLGQGTVTVTATANDGATTPTTSLPDSFVIDTVAPAQPVIDLGGLTILNAAEAASDLEITIPGTNGDTVSVTFTGTGGSVVKSGTIANNDFTATLTPAELQSLGQGTVGISATATDPAGNTSSAGTASFVQDTVAPSVTGVTFATNDGALAAGEALEITVTFSEAVTVAGGTPSLSLNSTGTAIYTGGSGSTALTFLYTPQPGESAADLAVTGLSLNGATLSDAGGNPAVTTGAAVNPDGIVAVDTAVPDAPVITGISDDTGRSATDGATQDHTLTISGTAEPGATVTVLLDGTSIGSVTANGSGNWTLDHTGTSLPDNAYALTATATDAAGNVSAASTSFALSVDNAAPGIPFITGIDTDTGSNPADGITSDTSITITGTAEPNATVAVLLGGSPLATVTADQFGQWTYDYSAPPAGGDYVFSATATDAAGNTSAVSADFAVTIDTTADSDVALANVDVVPATGGGIEVQFTIANLDPGSSVTISFSGSTGGSVAPVTYTYDDVVALGPGGHFTVDVSGLTGTLQAGFTVDDIAGNTASTPVSSLVEPVCFYPGTLIATAGGQVPVETLKRGDLVLTTEGRSVRVRWMGHQTVSTLFGDPLKVLPIRIRAGALGEAMPARDLLLSPSHAVLVGGVLVQAGALVNGTSIIREYDVPEVFSYWHIEVAEHDLVLAEGVPAETFVDNVDREAFDNWDEYLAIMGEETPIPEMHAPRAKSHRQVPVAIRRMIEARAARLQPARVARAA